jgi:GMP synthase (glutamine-hydrolysing)
MRILVAESETERARERRRSITGRSSGESYVATLTRIMPEARCEIIQPIETDERSEPSAALADYDAIMLAGSPMHVYEDTPPVRRLLGFMRAVFGSGTPSFGSCAGLQIAVAAAGGSVRENRDGHEVAFARRIVPTPAGRVHPLLRGRPDSFDAPAIHSDEVEALPAGAVLLATNGITTVQAAEISHDGGTFWGVQYHPELPLSEIADALRRQSEDVIEQGLADGEAAVESYAAMIDALDREPHRRDLAWRLGVDGQVTCERLRQAELRNFIDHLVRPTRTRRGRGD